jgi:NAD(P)H-hydrate repair Nnr-like enzyme with NAD(P)H-hydrate dehydratase domain
MNKDYKEDQNEIESIKELSIKLNNNITIIKKGQDDIIFDKSNSNLYYLEFFKFILI